MDTLEKIALDESAIARLQEVNVDPSKLKSARGKRRLTQCAKAIGVTRQQLWNYENAQCEMSSSTFAKLCILYRVSLEAVLNVDEDFLKKMYSAT
jgi:transcriptional regulator with XRE-family HTH domain